nr:hypothetical protein [Tanacetum cinerariifolium]
MVMIVNNSFPNHSIQNEESFENPSNEIAVSNFNQEKEEPPQDSDICQLIRKECSIEDSDIHQLIEECSIKVPEEQKQKMEDTMLELFKICQEKEFLCIHNDVDDLIKSALDAKLLLINSNSQRLDKQEQEVKNVIEQPAERGNRSIQSLQNFKVVHTSSISFKNTSQISLIHSVVPIQSTREPEHLLREEIQVVMIGKDKFDDDSQIFMFDKVFSLLSAESEDTIFDPGIFD